MKQFSSAAGHQYNDELGAFNMQKLPCTSIGNFSRREILAKMTLGRCVKFSPSPIFAILIEEYSMVYSSLCLFLAISGRSRTQRKLNPREKFKIYGISTSWIFLRHYIANSPVIPIVKKISQPIIGLLTCWADHSQSEDPTLIDQLTNDTSHHRCHSQS